MKINGILVSLAVYSATTLAAADDSGVTLTPSCSSVMENTDFFGGDIANKPGTLDECCGLCVNQAGCTAWTWSDYNGGTCWLKSSNGTPQFAPGKTSATVINVVPQCGLVFADTDFYGDDIGNVPNTDKNCCKPCQDKLGCQAWTWTSYNGGTCWLKSGQGQHQQSVGAVSGTVIGPEMPTTVAPTTAAPTTSAPTTAAPTSAAQCSSPMENTDFYGSDIANKPGTVDACCNLCKSQSGCNAWTWSSYNGGTCWLKSNNGTPQFTPGVTSGTILSVAPQCGSVFQDTDFYGADIGNVPSTQQDCCKPCQEKAGCMAWTWSNYNGGTCWLKSGQGQKQAATGKVSGVMVAPTAPASRRLRF